MPIDINGKTIATDAEGYLVDPADWDDAVAAVLARQEAIELGEEHGMKAVMTGCRLDR